MGRKRHSDRSHAAAGRGIDSPRLHLILYSLLLVATPFIMLHAYMQQAIGRLSLSRIPIGDSGIPAVPVAAVLVVAGLYLVFRPKISRRRLFALAVGLGMVALAQRITDYYFGHRFYEIQVNWHYFAYAIFAFMAYRDLRPRGISLARTMLVTFGLAVVYSTFDEGFQLAMSSRIFDVSDIAKDTWGATTGITLILIGGEHPELRSGSWKRIRHASLRGYFSHPPSIWVLQIVLGIFFLGYASLLTDARYAGLIAVLVAGSIVPFFLVLHSSRLLLWRRVFLATAVIGVVTLGIQFARHRTDQIVSHRYGLTVYKGIPIPFFDVMVFPGGGFRLVDKKHYFNKRDREFLNRFKSDIILVGSGYQGEGGRGYPHQKGSGFVYNSVTGRGTQVIILNSREACELFTRLKEQGKNVLFVLHTTC
jgi:VanZ family protein